MLLDALQILGTFITEWEAGSILCELLLWTEQSAEAAALQLANIAAFYGFDGWLLNIENPILHRHVPNLVHFIRYSKVTLPSPPLPLLHWLGKREAWVTHDTSLMPYYHEMTLVLSHTSCLV